MADKATDTEKKGPQGLTGKGGAWRRRGGIEPEKGGLSDTGKMEFPHTHQTERKGHETQHR